MVAAVALCVAAATLNAVTRCGIDLCRATQARHLGLERAWFAQVRLDRARNRVERAILANDRLDVLTTARVLQEMNALTGETLWIAPVGNPNYPSLGPSAQRAAHCGAERHNAPRIGSHRRPAGDDSTREWCTRCERRPWPRRRCLFRSWMGGSRVIRSDQEIFTPWYFQSTGRVMVPPLVTAASVVWVTDSGHVYMGGAEEFGVHFRLETGSDILAAPAYRKPNIFIGTMSGELFAIDEASGAKRWKYATGYPIARARPPWGIAYSSLQTSLRFTAWM